MVKGGSRRAWAERDFFWRLLMKASRYSSLVVGVVAGMVAVAGLALPAAAQDGAPAAPAKSAEKAKAKLGAGDKAPALSIAKWLKGSPVESFESGKIYVVEFWATWCGPCRVSIPHLTELQKKYANNNVTIIGVSAEDEEKVVADFVSKQADKMDYVVAWDREGATDKAYMAASGQQGIPTAFIVGKQGSIEWIGHPMEMDEVLDQVVNGKWDSKAYAEQQRVVQDLMKEFQKAARGGDVEKLVAVAKQGVEKAPKQAGRMVMIAFGQQVAAGKTEAANAWAKELVAGTMKDDPMILNGLAWTMVDPEAPMKGADLDTALSAAQRADELTQHKDPQVIDTLARVYFLKGDKAKAVELQTKAVELAPDEMKSELEKALKQYKGE
jgi:thiol-disulfide isomerase/thioredoxin